MCGTLPALSVSAVFCIYDLCRRQIDRRTQARRLRERVAFMLWVAANLDEKESRAAVPVAASGGASEDE